MKNHEIKLRVTNNVDYEKNNKFKRAKIIYNNLYKLGLVDYTLEDLMIKCIINSLDFIDNMDASDKEINIKYLNKINKDYSINIIMNYDDNTFYFAIRMNYNQMLIFERTCYDENFFNELLNDDFLEKYKFNRIEIGLSLL